MHARAAQQDSGKAQSTSTSSSSQDSDALFLAKLVALSFGGGALIKYGSLVVPLAFYPSGYLAAAMVCLPPILYGVSLAVRK